jgi:hypothetical protein
MFDKGVDHLFGVFGCGSTAGNQQVAGHLDCVLSVKRDRSHPN